MDNLELEEMERIYRNSWCGSGTLDDILKLINHIRTLESALAKSEEMLKLFQDEHAAAVDELKGWGPNYSLPMAIRRMRKMIDDYARSREKEVEG